MIPKPHSYPYPVLINGTWRSGKGVCLQQKGELRQAENPFGKGGVGKLQSNKLVCCLAGGKLAAAGCLARPEKLAEV